MLALAPKPRSTPRTAAPPAPAPAPQRRGNAPAIPLHRVALGTERARSGDARTGDASPGAGAGEREAPDAVHQVLRSPGAPLPAGARGEMEARFGRDFAGVRIHTDARAAESARAVDAAAYTVGHDIVFASGRYDAAGTDGRRLLAHELAHVAQQPHAAPGGALRVASPHGPEEHEADAASRAVIAGHAPPPLSPARGGGGVARTWIYRQPPATKTKYPAVVDLTVTSNTLSGTLTSTAQVKCASAAEETEARTIIDGLQTKYGITLDTKKGADTVRSKVQGDPMDKPASVAESLDLSKRWGKLKDAVTSTVWDLPQLRALKEALAFFDPVAASIARLMVGGSGLSGYTFSRASTGLNDAKDARDPNVLGQHFSAEKNITLFDAAPGASTGLQDTTKAVLGTFVHEIAHALMGGGSAFVTKLNPPFWKDLTTQTGNAAAEAPITSYGQKDAGEDVAEATKFYFVERGTLQARCPQRFAIIDAQVKSWSRSPSPTP